MAAPEVLCAGIVVADHVSSPISHLPAAGELVLADQLLLTIGGCAANVAIDLVKLGVASGVLGCVGNDIFGRIVAEILEQQNVDVSGLQVRPEQSTSQTLIVNVVGQDRRFIHTFGANAVFDAADLACAILQGCRVLYLGGYLLMERVTPDSIAAVFAAARKKGIRTVLDVVTPGPGDYLSRLIPVLPHVDVFLPNNLEAELILGERDPIRQAERFHELGAETSIITLGQEGVVLISADERIRARTFTVPFVDGTGGGDAFAAGFITGMLRDLETEECLRLASAVGASCVRAIGTTTGVFNREECESFLKENSLQMERLI
jgi:sugar/nucleoside kinase (ribokinase family)